MARWSGEQASKPTTSSASLRPAALDRSARKGLVPRLVAHAPPIRRRLEPMMRSGTTLFVAALLLQMPAARTAPLDKEGCANLKAEQGQLEHAGVRGNMAKGPQWAKTNLEPEKLNQIRRLLEVDEQLLFRCQGKALVTLPKDLTDPDPAAREPGADGAKTGKAAKAPKEVAKKDPGKKEAVKKA